MSPPTRPSRPPPRPIRERTPRLWRPYGTCGWPTADDQDGDGYATSVDCNDLAPRVNPGALEIPCDFVDDDCDGADLCPVDNDRDGFGVSLDCDDSDYDINPSASETRIIKARRALFGRQDRTAASVGIRLETGCDMSSGTPTFSQ